MAYLAIRKNSISVLFLLIEDNLEYLVVAVVVVAVAVISFDHYCQRSCHWLHHCCSTVKYCLESPNRSRSSTPTPTVSTFVSGHLPGSHFLTAEDCSSPGSGSLARARKSSAAPSSVGSSVNGGSCSLVSCGSWAKKWPAVVVVVVVAAAAVVAAAVARTVEVERAVIVADVASSGD